MDVKIDAFYKPRMLAAGPTPLPHFVLSAMSSSVHYHRGPVFKKIMAFCRAELKKVFHTENEVLIFSGSGTMAMEGAVANFFNPGDEVICVNGGKFGSRWKDQCTVYGLKVHEIFVERGKSVNPDDVKKLLNENIRGVFLHSSETSTGARHNVKAVAAMTKSMPDCLTLVDGVTSIGVFKTPIDDWGVDVIVGGSQKGLALPPGLSFGCASKKAWARNETVKSPRYYMDWAKEHKAAQNNTGAFTSAVTLVGGLESVLKYFSETGLENVYERSWRYQYAARETLKEMGFKLLVENIEDASPACTAVYTEGVFNGSDISSRFGITMSGGQDELKGKIVRVAHIGYMDAWDVFMQIVCLYRLRAEKAQVGDLTKATETFFSILESGESRIPDIY